MKKITDSMINILFFLFITAVGVLFYVMPDKPTVSEREKRELAKVPEFSVGSVMDGSFASGYTAYYADNFPFRDTLITIAQRLDEYAGASDDGAQIIIVSDNDASAVEDFEAEELPPEESLENEAPPEEPEENEQSMETGEQPENDPDARLDDAKEITQSLYVAKDMVLTIPSQLKKVQKEYVAAVNDFADRYPDVNVHCGVIPIAAAYYLPEKYRNEYNDQQTMINYIYDRLDESVHRIDIYSALARHADEYIYFRTDHHWTGLGAYYAYSRFVSDIGMTPMDISSLPVVEYPDYLGSLYDKVGGNADMRANPDKVIAYDIDSAYPCQTEFWYDFEGKSQDHGPLIIKNLQRDNKYTVFTNGDWRYAKFVTGLSTGRKIMVFKDSFGNAFVPYLVANFDEVYVLDPRYSLPSVKKLIADNSITDVLFLTNITNTSVAERAKEYRRLYYI